MAQAAYPRWHPFLLTGLLAGLRSGETAALYKDDIDWRRGRIHVQRA
jgi:integrase